MPKELRVGDEVEFTKIGKGRFGNNDRYGHNKRPMIVEESRFGGLCVYNDARSGWVSEAMGVHECFYKVIRKNTIGGKLC